MDPRLLPVDLPVLLAFIGASLVMVLTPGPDTLLILRYTMGSGQRVGLATVAGVQTGLVGHTLAAVVGLSVLVATTPMALQAIAAAGAAYLAWLGVQSLRAGVVAMDKPGVKVGPVKAWRDAAVTNLLNPKVLLLFLALMPQFVVMDRGRSVAAQLTLLGAVLIVINTVWQTVLAVAADRIRHWLGRPSVQRGTAVATGLVFLAFAVLMLADFVF